MNYFSKWLRKTRRTRLKIHRFGLKTVTFLHGMSLLFWVYHVDSMTDWKPFAIMIFNAAWCYLMAYCNGWIYDTKPYYTRDRGY